jgi:predicted metal-dependent hydrolase
MSRRSDLDGSQLPLALGPGGPGSVPAPPCRVRVSRRARRLLIEVTPFHGVEVIVPPRQSRRRVASFVASNQGWIAEVWAEVIKLFPGEVGARVPERLELRAFDESWAVRAEVGHEHVAVRGRDGVITLQAPDATLACRALQRWTAQRARTEFLPRLADLAKATGLRYQRVQVRGQRTLWGSCSTRGTISLNWKLAFLEPDLVRYLMLHELTHLRHFNHSRAFWNLVGVFEPAARALDDRLDEAWTRVPKWVEA